MTTDVLVIGGGLAGAAAAIELAHAARHVTIIERARAPQNKVCGEFLSAEALHYLAHLNIDIAKLGAVPLSSVRLTGSGTAVKRTLPFAAMSLTRRCLDESLLQQAESAGAHVQRGCTVERLMQQGDKWLAKLAGGDAIDAHTIFLAAGKHDLRGFHRPAGKQPNLVAFKMYWRLQPEQTRALGHAVELITYRGGYAGLQPVEGGLANLCCLIHAGHLRRIGGTWHALLQHMQSHSPHLRERLHHAEPALPKPLTVASIPYGFVRESSDGLWYLGDQAAVIPSFTGDGMSLALHTASLAVTTYLSGQSAHTYQQTVARQLRRQVAIATAVSKAVVDHPRASLVLAKLWPSSLAFIARRTRIAGELLAP